MDREGAPKNQNQKIINNSGLYYRCMSIKVPRMKQYNNLESTSR